MKLEIMKIRNIALLTVMVLGLGFASMSNAVAQTSTSEDSEWSFDVQLYLLVLWIQGDSQMGPLPKAFDVDVTPHDIFSNLDLGGMAHFEAHRNRGWGVWLDYAFMDLSKKASFGEGGMIENQLGVYQGVMEAFAMYRMPLEKGYMDYFGGVRWWHNDFDYSISIIDNTRKTSRTIDWCDPIIGLRWTQPLSERWDFRARADIGGFSMASDFTSAIVVGAMYDLSENWQLDMRFKSMWVNYDEGTRGNRDRFTYKTVNYGPILGVSYKF